MPANLANDTLLITSASGKQASHLIPFLLPKWHHIRLAVKSDSSYQSLQKTYSNASTIEIVQADISHPADCHRICQNATSIYHINPTFHPRETQLGYNMIDAACANGTQHFVYSSVLHPILTKLLNHDAKRYVEEYLIESGLQYTILQPSHFMDMFPIGELIKEENPVYTARWDPDVKFSFTSLSDMGEAAANILEQREAHFFATYQLVSTAGPPIGWRRVCEIASRVMGKGIRVEVMPFQKTMDDSVEGMFGLQESPHARDTAQRMLLWYQYRGLVGCSNVLGWLLGREPVQWEGWVRGVVEEMKGERGAGFGEGLGSQDELSRSSRVSGRFPGYDITWSA